MNDLSSNPGETLIRGIIGKVTGLFSGKLLLYGSAVLLLALGVQTLRLSWAETRIARMETAQAKAIEKAVQKRLEAERQAQSNHEGREEARQVSSDALQRKADAAPEGAKTKAVLDGLRGK